MIHEAVAVVTVVASKHVQTNHHLGPVPTLAQVLWETSQVTFGQPFQLLIYFLPLLVGKNALHPKHDPDLHFYRQHVAKRFVLGVDQPSAVHPNRVKTANDLSTPHHLINPLVSTNHTLAPDPLEKTYKSVPMGGTP